MVTFPDGERIKAYMLAVGKEMGFDILEPGDRHADALAAILDEVDAVDGALSWMVEEGDLSYVFAYESETGGDSDESDGFAGKLKSNGDVIIGINADALGRGDYGYAVLFHELAHVILGPEHDHDTEFHELEYDSTLAFDRATGKRVMMEFMYDLTDESILDLVEGGAISGDMVPDYINGIGNSDFGAGADKDEV